MLEQRKSRRFDLTLPIELLHNGAGSPPQTGETTNVSSAGVLFSCGAAVHAGDTVEYVITLPNASTSLQVRLRCRGKIVRRSEDTHVAATMERWQFERSDAAPPDRK